MLSVRVSQTSDAAVGGTVIAADGAPRPSASGAGVGVVAVSVWAAALPSFSRRSKIDGCVGSSWGHFRLRMAVSV